MNGAPQMWGVAKTGTQTGERMSLRTLIEEQLPETRIFVDELYREFSNSGSRNIIDRMVQDRNRNPWPLVDSDPR